MNGTASMLSRMCGFSWITSYNSSRFELLSILDPLEKCQEQEEEERRNEKMWITLIIYGFLSYEQVYNMNM